MRLIKESSNDFDDSPRYLVTARDPAGAARRRRRRITVTGARRSTAAVVIMAATLAFAVGFPQLWQPREHRGVSAKPRLVVHFRATTQRA